jgi:hypothetical protein
MDGTQTNTGGRVAVAEGVEPAAGEAPPLAQSVDPKANVYLRLWRIERELGAVEKSQTATVKLESGGQYTYKFSGHDLIIAAVNPLLAKHGVKVWPTTIGHERTGNMTVLTVRMTFVNVDEPTDVAVAEVVNYGADKGDKGASKALTNCIREAVKKALNITSEEDDRANEHTDYQTNEGATRADLDKAKDQRRAAIEQWAKTFKMALQKAATKKDIQRLQRENAEQLSSEDLPEVTRTFFVELIQERLGALV